MEQKELKMGVVFSSIKEAQSLVPKGFGTVAVRVNGKEEVQIYCRKLYGKNSEELDDNYLGAKLRFKERAIKIVN